MYSTYKLLVNSDAIGIELLKQYQLCYGYALYQMLYQLNQSKKNKKPVVSDYIHEASKWYVWKQASKCLESIREHKSYISNKIACFSAKSVRLTSNHIILLFGTLFLKSEYKYSLCLSIEEKKEITSKQLVRVDLLYEHDDWYVNLVMNQVI